MRLNTESVIAHVPVRAWYSEPIQGFEMVTAQTNSDRPGAAARRNTKTRYSIIPSDESASCEQRDPAAMSWYM
jgi:hypothetical protein